MKTEIFRINCIEIENTNGDRLKIHKYDENKTEEKSCLSIKSSDSEWKLKTELQVKDRYIYKKRTGIWFEKEPDLRSVFTRVSLFEETKYSFKFKTASTSLDEMEDIKDENLRFRIFLGKFFIEPQKWISKSGFIKDSEEERDQYKISREFKDNNTWELNFMSYTGRLKLKKDIIKNELNDIEILPRKLTKDNYTLILNKLTIFVSKLFFQFKSPTEISASRDFIQSEYEKDILYFFPKTLLLELIMKEISSYFYGLTNQLNTKFVYLREKIENYKLTDPTTINYVETITHPGNLLIVSDFVLNNSVLPIMINKKKYVLNDFIINSQNLSFDTQENRFVKFVLRLLLFDLSDKNIKKVFKDLGKENAIEEYISYLNEKIKFLEAEGVKDLYRIPLNSQLLSKNSYYRRFLQYFMWLQYPTIFNIDKLFTIDLKPMHLLYEYFCLYTMKRALDRIAKANKLLCHYSDIPEDCYDVIDVEGKESLNFRKIKCITFKYRNRNKEEIQLIFKTEGLDSSSIKREIDNKDFRMPYSRFRSNYSNSLRKKPDYALLKLNNNKKVCENEDGRNSLVILDAKYRPDTQELWDKMHLYKDSLMAIGSIFINPFTISEDDKYSKKLITIYGELFAENLVAYDGKISSNRDLFQKAKSSGFVSGINLLGLRECNNNYMELAVNDFQELFEKILKIYFQ